MSDFTQTDILQFLTANISVNVTLKELNISPII